MSLVVDASECRLNVPADRLELVAVIDGDTLRVKSAQKAAFNIRVIGLNTPELGRDGGEDQPLAWEAKRGAERFLESGVLLVRWGQDRRDHYGRQLAHVYNDRGGSLTAKLLGEGLAWHVVVANNDYNWRCYREQERKARSVSRGVWSQNVLEASTLSAHPGGFAVVEGVVERVDDSRHWWWLEMGDLAVSIPKHRGEFEDFDPKAWRGRKLLLKGWLIKRDNAGAKRKPYRLKLEHPSMILN